MGNAGVRWMTAEDVGSGGSMQKLSEDVGRCSLTYYNRIFGGWAEVMCIILPLTELLTVPGHAGS